MVRQWEIVCWHEVEVKSVRKNDQESIRLLTCDEEWIWSWDDEKKFFLVWFDQVAHHRYQTMNRECQHYQVSWRCTVASHRVDPTDEQKMNSFFVWNVMFLHENVCLFLVEWEFLQCIDWPLALLKNKRRTIELCLLIGEKKWHECIQIDKWTWTENTNNITIGSVNHACILYRWRLLMLLVFVVTWHGWLIVAHLWMMKERKSY